MEMDTTFLKDWEFKGERKICTASNKKGQHAYKHYSFSKIKGYDHTSLKHILGRWQDACDLWKPQTYIITMFHSSCAQTILQMIFYSAVHFPCSYIGFKNQANPSASNTLRFWGVEGCTEQKGSSAIMLSFIKVLKITQVYLETVSII